MKHSYKSNLLRDLNSLTFFTKNGVLQLGKNENTYNLTDSTVNTYISRYLDESEIILLKKGFYISKEFYDKHKTEPSYLFYLANVLRGPSYISSWTALQYYNLCTEIIYSINSVSPKITRNYETKIGNFLYHNIKEDLFFGYEIKKSKFDFFMATPAKALFDMLYFKTKQFRNIKLADIDYILEDLRIDIDEMSVKERKNFYSLVKNYLK
jgi:predicted transcriptional regulator of viral defense system